MDLLDRKYKWGRTTLDYLCMNNVRNSTEFIKTVVELRLDRCIKHFGLERWRTAATNGIDALSNGDASDRTSYLVTLLLTFAKYERMEGIALLELVLRKWRIGCEADTAASSNRKSCRVTCGANVVIPNALSFLLD